MLENIAVMEVDITALVTDEGLFSFYFSHVLFTAAARFFNLGLGFFNFICH